MKKEIWKAIEGYKDYYEVSSYGRVRSLDRMVTYSNGRKRLHKGRMLRLAKQKKGYLGCDLCKNGQKKTVLIHRLVAEAFLPNPHNLPEVNHRDEVKVNNHVENLEWCDSKYNINYGTCIQRRTETQLNSPKLSKPVLQIDLETNQIIAEYPSVAEAGRKLNISPSGISMCCKGKCRTAHNYKWQYKKE